MILQRKLLPGWQLRALRRYSRHLVYDFDDAVRFRDSYDERGHESRWRSRRFAQTVRMADTVVAGNDFLADCALRDGAKVERVHVIPTCVEPAIYPIARQDAAADHHRPCLDWFGEHASEGWNNHVRSGNGWRRHSLNCGCASFATDFRMRFRFR